MTVLRTFVALEMPVAIEDQLSNVIATLKADLKEMPVRWVAVENIHLTLKFIGETSEENVQQVSSLVEQCAKNVESFDLQLKGFGVFPDTRRPLVLWVGVSAPENLATLQQKIENGLARLGYPVEDRPFNPHLTIGRVRRGTGGPDAKRIMAAMDAHKTISSDPVLINSVTLFQSVLNRSGSVYNRLFSAPLVGAG
jgi:RNA 2',3'-cyclic 3'-phosphodiesterase